MAAERPKALDFNDTEGARLVIVVVTVFQLETPCFLLLLVALREGVEAAFVVGIVLVYLNRTGRRALTKYVWAGVALAAAASVVAAILLDRWKVSEDGFEGLLMLVASALVVTMIVWMNRVARTLRKRHRIATGNIRPAIHSRGRMGNRSFRVSDGCARRRGACTDPASGGTIKRGRRSLDRNAFRNRACCRGRDSSSSRAR